MKNNTFLANVKILNKSLNQSFTYMIDSSLYKVITYTDLVLIQFNNRFEIGMIINKYTQQESLPYEPKIIYKVLKQNRISKSQLQLVENLENKIFAPKEDIINLILKKNTTSSNTLQVIIKDEVLKKDFLKFANKDNKILYKNLPKDIKKNTVKLLEDKLIDIVLLQKDQKNLNVFKLKEEIKQEDKIKIDKEITNKYFIKKDLISYYNISDYTYTKLKKLDLLDERLISKSEYKPLEESIELQKTVLTQQQQQSFKQIKDNINNKLTLLHGITGSGKTSIFTKLIEEQIKEQKQILILVPEITLTLQMIDNLTNHFGKICAFFNTSLSKNEHDKLLNKIQNKEVKIIISTRSGIFLNIPDLSLVIVDEEHDSSYKQNFYPYYHVDDMIDYWQNNNIKVLYSSATPRLLTYAKAKKNIYELVQLKVRYNNYSLPEVILKEYEQDNIINKEFINIIEQQIKLNQNVLILFNVKGYSKTVECPDCGNIEMCPNCNLPMKYFKKSKNVQCSYCDYKIQNYTKCSTCSNQKLNLIGLGIEQIQEQIQKYFNTKVLRIDSQVAKTTQKVNSIIKDFNASTGNILIGTQIIAKGLNFNNLNQVIVLNTDNMLYFSDFSSYETAYQLLEQVSGRSGRKEETGKVYIYTNHKDNFIYKAVQNHDYEYFYNKEMENRKLQKTLPYYYICQIEFRSKNVKKYENKIIGLKLELEDKGFIVTKVVQPYLEKIGEEKRLKLFVKYKKENIKQELENLIKQEDFGTCKVLVDLNIMNYGF